MNVRNIRTVWLRELRDVVRDRRTLFTMLVLPVILYPALMLGFTKLTVSRSAELLKKEFPVVFRAGGRPVLRGAEAAPEGSLEAALLEVDQFRFVDVPDPVAAVSSGEAKLAAEGIPDERGGLLPPGRKVEITPQFRSADEESAAALRLFQRAFDGWRESRWPARLLYEGGDQSTEEERGGRTWGGLLAMMVVLMAMTGAFYPALDVAAGEKERGTLETLLLSPASRRELVLGKFLTVFTVASVAALVNLTSLSFAVEGFSSMLPAKAGGSLGVSAKAFAVILLGLLVTAGLFSALCLALSTFARTYKEGQAYLTPALLLVVPLGMVALLPNMTFDLGTALVPVANLALLMKDVLSGSFHPAETAVALLTLLVCAVAALAWAASLFDREEVLFREGRQVFGLRPPPGVLRPGAPPVAAGLLGLLAGFAWLYHAGVRSGAGTAAVLVPMAGLAIIALGVTRLSLAPVGSSLRLDRADARGLLAGAALGLSGLFLSAGIAALQSLWLGSSEDVATRMEDALGETFGRGLVVAVLVIAVVPAVAEELLFRGLLLRSLRGSFGAAAAVAVSAAAFGAFHLSPHRFLPQAVLGALLGVLALRSGSLWPAVVAHAAHNGLAVVLLDAGLGDEAIPPWTILPAAAVAAGALLRVRPDRTGRRGPA